MSATKIYTVTVESCYEGCRPHAEFKVSLPLTDREAYDYGSQWPTAREIARHWAGEFCDSGTVRVVNDRDRDDRGLVARATIS